MRPMHQRCVGCESVAGPRAVGQTQADEIDDGENGSGIGTGGEPPRRVSGRAAAPKRAGRIAPAR